MKRVSIYDFGGPEVLTFEDADPPAVGAGQLSIRVAACGVNPVDWKIRSGAARAIVTTPLPVVPGGDLAGTVDAVGEGVVGFAVGEAVFAHPGLMGGYAEQVVVDASACAKAPAGLGMIQAASLPLAALTALQGFEADGRDLAGLTVLVHNAAGGVGSLAVQIAKALGARVIATASAANAAFVLGLGADEVVDFRQTPVAGRDREVDILIDMVGDKDALALWSLVRRGGSVVRVAGGADAPPSAEADGVRVLKIRVRPDGAGLEKLAAMAADGALKPEVAQTFPLAEAAQAHRLSQAGHVRGKIVLITGA